MDKKEEMGKISYIECMDKLDKYVDGQYGSINDAEYVKLVNDVMSLVNYHAVMPEEKQKCLDALWMLTPLTNAFRLEEFSKCVLKFIKCGMTLCDKFISWYLNAFILWPQHQSPVEIIRVLQALLENNKPVTNEVTGALLKGIVRFISHKRSAVFCSVESATIIVSILNTSVSVVSPSELNTIGEVVLCLLQNVECSKDKIATSQLLLAEIELLQAVCEKNAFWIVDRLGIMLGIVLHYCWHGLKEFPSDKPVHLQPFPAFEDEPTAGSAKETGRNKLRRKQKKNVIEKAKQIRSTTMDDTFLPELYWTQTSESEYSDSEAGFSAKLKKSDKKVRIASLSLLLHLVRITNKKILAGYWNQILDGPSSLLQCLQKEHSPHCKVTICAILMVLLSDGKLFIAQAQHSSRDGSLSYKTWSSLLADLISSIHDALCACIKQTQYRIVQSAILRCLAVLISITPYNRLNSGLITNAVRSIKPLLSHPDPALRIATLKCLKEVIVVEPQIKEQLDCLSCICSTSDLDEPRCESEIVTHILSLLQNEKCPVLLRAECWNVVNALAKFHFETRLAGENSQRILQLLTKDMNNSNAVVQQCALKALEQLAIPVASLGPRSGIDGLSMWVSLLNGPLIPLLQDANGALTAAACDCVSNVSCDTFQHLPEKMQICVMTILFGCVSHEDHLARAAAVRTLGIIVVFPFLAKDIQIIYDVAERVVWSLRDTNLCVRVKAAWSLGNLSEVLLLGRQRDIPVEEVPLISLLEIGVKTGEDHEKVKTCSIRAIGYLLQLIEDKHLEVDKIRVLLIQTVNMLIYNATTEGNMKVRWNACYALGNMFKNSVLVPIYRKCQGEILGALSSLLVNCSNFKVRQSACAGLIELRTRDLYEPYFADLLRSVSDGLEKAQVLQEFSEYKHQNNLIQQLCATFCHLVQFIKIQDLPTLHDVIKTNDELLEKCLRNFSAQPKDDDIIQNATNCIDYILVQRDLKTEYVEMLKHLKEIMQSSPASICTQMSSSQSEIS